MRLTNDLRDAFIRAVMAKLPSFNYEEKIIKEEMTKLDKELPPDILAIWKDEEKKKYLNLTSFYIEGNHKYIYFSHPAKRVTTSLEKSKLFLEWENKNTEIKEAKEGLRRAVYACNTSKQLIDKFPEFKNLVPGEAEKTKYLPEVTGVVKKIFDLGYKE